MFATPATRAILFCLPLLLVHPPVARADDGEKTLLAAQVLELAYSPGSLRDNFSGFLDPALDAMARDGMPPAARDEVRKAFTQWIDQEVKWEDIKPKLVEIYARDFTGEELRALLSFLRNPLGRKVISKLPLVMHDGSVAGQQYFTSKQDSLNAKLAPIIAKYKSRTGG